MCDGQRKRDVEKLFATHKKKLNLKGPGASCSTFELRPVVEGGSFLFKRDVEKLFVTAQEETELRTDMIHNLNCVMNFKAQENDQWVPQAVAPPKIEGFWVGVQLLGTHVATCD